MKKKFAILLAMLVFLVPVFGACSSEDGQNASQGSPKANVKTVVGDTRGGGATPAPAEEQERVKRELEKVKEEGILDENGQPAPGVDLNDYPGLG